MAHSPQLPMSGMPLTTGEREVVSIFVQMAQTMGAPRSLGEIYGLLYATARPLSFQDIADKLELSKGSVSQGLRFLRTVGAIQPVEVPGDRKEYYEPVVELRALVGGFLRERINPQLQEWGKRAKALKIEDFQRADSLEPGAGSDDRTDRNSPLTADDSKLIQSRIDKLRSWQKQAGMVLPMISKLLG